MTNNVFKAKLSIVSISKGNEKEEYTSIACQREPYEAERRFQERNVEGSFRTGLLNFLVGGHGVVPVNELIRYIRCI